MATATRERPVAKKQETKVPIASQISHRAGHHAGAAILLELDRRFPAVNLEPMLDECVIATGEMEFANLLKRFWLNGQVHDVTHEERLAVRRTSDPHIQLQIELIARGFLAAQVKGEDEPREKAVRVVKPTHRCPKCWGTAHGKIGKRRWQRQVNGPAVERCYRCDQPDCDCEWIVECRAEDSDGVQFITEKIIEVRNGN